jgi:hypothetical protein
LRKTSSSVGPTTSIRVTGVPAAASPVTRPGTASRPKGARTRTLVSVTVTWAPGIRSAPAAPAIASATVPNSSDTRSPSEDFSAAAVSSAITRPWSMTITRPASASASSR